MRERGDEGRVLCGGEGGDGGGCCVMRKEMPWELYMLTLFSLYPAEEASPANSSPKSSQVDTHDG